MRNGPPFTLAVSFLTQPRLKVYRIETDPIKSLQYSFGINRGRQYLMIMATSSAINKKLEIDKKLENKLEIHKNLQNKLEIYSYFKLEFKLEIFEFFINGR